MWLMGLGNLGYRYAAKRHGLTLRLMGPSVIQDFPIIDQYIFVGGDLGWIPTAELIAHAPHFPYGYAVDPDIH